MTVVMTVVKQITAVKKDPVSLMGGAFFLPEIGKKGCKASSHDEP